MTDNQLKKIILNEIKNLLNEQSESDVNANLQSAKYLRDRLKSDPRASGVLSAIDSLIRKAYPQYEQMLNKQSAGQAGYNPETGKKIP
jgi:predicted component of type VI protein secretion system